MTPIPFTRRQLVVGGALAGATAALPHVAFAQERRFDPQPGAWRTFEVTTRVEIKDPAGPTLVWLPVPSVDSAYQRSLDSAWTGNAATAAIVSDRKYGAKILQARFDGTTAAPMLELKSKVQTRSRATDWKAVHEGLEDPASLRTWTQPTELIPTDGIVLETARSAIGDASTDEQKVRRIYDWVVSHTYREPAVRGCGVGDIKTMLETQNFGGKCGDINGLFVGLCRSVGIPARDVYGLRIAPSAFGYRELGGNPTKLQGAQHCRAEAWLQQRGGWVAMDPADVGKVMRLETPVWIKDVSDPLVVPVNRALFGGWEGNWMAYNTAHDIVLPGSRGPKVGFFMYPQAENENGRYDAIDADNFRYTIVSTEVAG
jgi:transglutaminase-like putative cysteine protease